MFFYAKRKILIDIYAKRVYSIIKSRETRKIGGKKMKLDKKAFDLALAKAKLTKQEISQKSGVSSSTITKLLSESQNMRPSTAGKISEALGCNVSDIIKEE